MRTLLLFLFCSTCCCLASEELLLLRDALHAVSRGLRFMEDRVSEINLDAAFGCRLIENVFHSFLSSRPDIFDLEIHLRDQLETLSAKADRIAKAAKRYLKINDPWYFGVLGGLLDESEVLMWYPSRLTKSTLKVHPLSCSESIFNETLSDQCLHGILGSREDRSDGCILRQECLNLMTRPGQKGYMLTHQMLYFQLVEMRGCLGNLPKKKIPETLQDQLCSNVMRDAEEIAHYDYPINHRDLFMEQIGLCGMWGYRDFYKQKWLKDILQWQLESGCYENRYRWICTDDLSKLKIRHKREEKILSDGCSCHKTTVALLAIATNVRFIIEDIFSAK